RAATSTTTSTRSRTRSNGTPPVPRRGCGLRQGRPSQPRRTRQRPSPGSSVGSRNIPTQASRPSHAAAAAGERGQQMDTSPIFGLGYVRAWEANLEQWDRFAEGVLGMMAERDGESRLLVRMDDWIGRFIVEEGKASFAEGPGSLVPDVAIGWECP